MLSLIRLKLCVCRYMPTTQHDGQALCCTCEPRDERQPGGCKLDNLWKPRTAGGLRREGQRLQHDVVDVIGRAADLNARREVHEAGLPGAQLGAQLRHRRRPQHRDLHDVLNVLWSVRPVTVFNQRAVSKRDGVRRNTAMQGWG